MAKSTAPGERRESPIAAAAHGKAQVGHDAHTLRIVGGRWKRSRLPVANRPGLRPTPDRVRETLFNWLGQDLTGWICIDAFAGTGALGFEAASRGAAEVLLIEQDRALVLQLAQVKQRLQADMLRILRDDALAVLARHVAGSVDLVFIDPPFDSNLFEPALRAASAVIRPSGYIYLEAPVQWNGEMAAKCGLAITRHMKAGAVHAHLLQRAASPHA